MARITPIDVIKGISGKYGGNSNDYFATNITESAAHRPYRRVMYAEYDNRDMYVYEISHL